MFQRYTLIADLPSVLPLFPLTGAILLPRATLPLNIFEPRYLEMVDDAIRGDRLIGLVQPMGEGGATGSPQERDARLHQVGCAGRITTFQELEDGRFLIALTGVARFVPAAEQATSKPYRCFAVDWRRHAGDLAAGVGEAEVNRALLLETLRRYLEQNRLRTDWDEIERAGTEHLVNWLSVVSPFSPEEKQALVEAATLSERASILIALAEMAMAATDGGSSNRMQ